MRVGGLRRGERQAREHRERVVAGEGDTVAGHRQRHRERSDGGGSEGGTRARIANGGSGGGEAGGEALAGDSRERKMLDYVTGVADAAAIRAGTPRTPPSRPASSSVSRPGTGASAGSGARAGRRSVIPSPR